MKEEFFLDCNLTLILASTSIFSNEQLEKECEIWKIFSKKKDWPHVMNKLNTFYYITLISF